MNDEIFLSLDNQHTLFRRVCKHCQQAFTTDEPRRRYCGDKCKQKAANARNYRKHAEQRIAKTIRNRKAKQA